MMLNYKKMGDGGPPLMILHGLFGMLDNWQTIGRQLAEQFTVYLVDQRNHGKSPHSDDFDYYYLSEDVLEWMNELNLDQADILGHSMGGKTAMQFAIDHPERVHRLIIVDIAPKDYPPGHQNIFDGFFAVPIDEIESRQAAEAALSEHIQEVGVRQFLLKNLSRQKEGTYRWKCHLNALYRHYDNIIANTLSFYDVHDGSTLFIKGEKSPRYIELPEDEQLLHHHFPAHQMVTIPNAGHWVHAEQPALLLEAVLRFLNAD